MGHMFLELRGLSDPLAGQVAWALIHFVWQGAAIAALLALLLRMRGMEAPQRRHALSVASLVLMALCPLFTLLEFRLQPVFVTSGNSLKAELQPSDIFELADPAIVATDPTINWQPYVLAAWLIGVLFLACRLLAGYGGTLWLRGQRRPLDAELSSRLSHRLGVTALRRVYASPRVREALVVGFWRPIVLVPLAWLTELPPDVLEAVIAHELAHLRRWDRWVVLFQRIVETLLFYHPAVWWVSRQISLERELCCDELAVLATGRRLAYARALETVGQRHMREASLVFATSFHGEAQMNLLHRVRNVLGLGSPRESGLAWPAGVLALTLTAGMACWSLSSVTAAEDEKDKPKAAREGEVRKDGEQEKRKSPEAEAAKRKSPEAEGAKKRVSEEELNKRKLEAKESVADSYKRKVAETFRKEGEAKPLGDFKPETDREAALYKMVLMLREELAQLRQEVSAMRKGGDSRVKAGTRDGDAPKKPGPRDSDDKKPGARDGDAPAKPGPRDGDAPVKKGPRDGDAPAKPGTRDGDKAPQ